MRVESDGEVLADSPVPASCSSRRCRSATTCRPRTCGTDLLRPSDKTTICAYKGQASYWSLEGEDDLVWSYPEPLRDAAEVAGRLAFFNERVDIAVDGVPLERPVTPWSRR